MKSSVLEQEAQTMSGDSGSDGTEVDLPGPQLDLFACGSPPDDERNHVRQTLYDYLQANNTQRGIESIIRKAVSNAAIPSAWFEDARQEILIAWINVTPDTANYSRNRIFAYASWIAYHAATKVASRVAATVAVPSTAKRQGKRSYTVPFDTLSVTSMDDWLEWSLDLPTVDEALTVLDDGESYRQELLPSGMSAHQIIRYGNPRKRRLQTLIIAWMSNGLEIEEMAEAARVAKRTIYVYLAGLREANRDIA